MNRVNAPARPFRNLLGCAAFLTMVSTANINAFAADASRPALPGGIYDKPYLHDRGGRVSVGGYMDMEYEWNEGGDNTFDQHRFIPFITGQVSERVRVSAEIEFEHGGNIGGDGEVKLEYAVLDFAITEAINFRGGVILSPLGAFNLLHDSPLNDLTARPIVSTQLLPSTLSESGMGVFGEVALSEEWIANYEAYLVNGLNEDVLNGVGSLRVRGGRGSQKRDNNQNKALVARLGLSPRIGTVLGASLHTGNYDASDQRRLTMVGVDAKSTFGPLELQGELAFVHADIDAAAQPHAAESQRGGYAQANYHVLHDTLLPGSVVTLAARGDWVDFDGDLDGDSQDGLTLGVNFRPTEETVFKADYNLSRTTPANGDADETVGRFFFSFATYF